MSQKHRQMAQTLDLVLLDERYLPEARRMAVRRAYGRVPEGLPLLETPTGFWHLPFDLRTQDPLHKAQDLVYDGWEALAESSRRAERHFRKALEIDPFLADAYNGLGAVAEATGDLEAAEGNYRKAYEVARETLGSESPNAYYWWGELETRPYMRARQGLGGVYWEQRRYREALTEYEALLHLNENDNQGVRYVIAPLYHLAGDLKGALKAYKRYAKQYPGDRGDPHHTFCWGLALYAAGRREDAVRRWGAGLFQNVYLAPLLLQEPVPRADVWHSTNLEWADYAEDYRAFYDALWDQVPGAKETLQRLWHDPEVEDAVKRWLEIGRTMKKRVAAVRRRTPAVDEEWRRLWEEKDALVGLVPSAATLERVLSGAPG